MASVILLMVVGVTSLGAFLVATRRAGLGRAALRRALADLFAYLGLAVIFLVANLVVGVTLIVTVRALTHRFVSLYVLNDATLVFLSLLQALVLHCWRQRSK